ncbi:hypothetical protein Anapl_16184 [Anas platyrhynchos]|uniref:Uncharacterized protein n=1 Tax=Anas platyrhynchos TaxID=8839 RepID=R0JKH2_ANAPL|nr:hypothetical protein Anapl_16184 [Anas platyrhynchos]
MLFGSQNSRPCTGRLRPPARRAQHNPTSHSRVTRESSVWALLLKTGCSSSGVSELLTLPRQKELHGSEECFSVQKQFFHSNEAKKLTKQTFFFNIFRQTVLSECRVAGHSSAVRTAGHNAKNKPVKILACGISIKIRSLHIKCTLLLQLPGGITSSLSAVAWNKCLLPPHSWKQIVSLQLLERIQNCGTGTRKKHLNQELHLEPKQLSAQLSTFETVSDSKLQQRPAPIGVFSMWQISKKDERAVGSGRMLNYLYCAQFTESYSGKDGSLAIDRTPRLEKQLQLTLYIDAQADAAGDVTGALKAAAIFALSNPKKPELHRALARPGITLTVSAG